MQQLLPAGGKFFLERALLLLAVEGVALPREARRVNSLAGVSLRRHSELYRFQAPVMSMSSWTIWPCLLMATGLM